MADNDLTPEDVLTKVRELYATTGAPTYKLAADTIESQARRIAELESALVRTEAHWRQELEAYKLSQPPNDELERYRSYEHVEAHGSEHQPIWTGPRYRIPIGYQEVSNESGVSDEEWALRRAPEPDTSRQSNLVWAVRQLLDSLPQRRDWLDPVIEKVLREETKRAAHETSTIQQSLNVRSDETDTRNSPQTRTAVLSSLQCRKCLAINSGSLEDKRGWEFTTLTGWRCPKCASETRDAP